MIRATVAALLVLLTAACGPTRPSPPGQLADVLDVAALDRARATADVSSVVEALRVDKTGVASWQGAAGAVAITFTELHQREDSASVIDRMHDTAVLLMALSPATNAVAIQFPADTVAITTGGRVGFTRASLTTDLGADPSSRANTPADIAALVEWTRTH